MKKEERRKVRKHCPTEKTIWLSRSWMFLEYVLLIMAIKRLSKRKVAVIVNTMKATRVKRGTFASRYCCESKPLMVMANMV